MRRKNFLIILCMSLFVFVGCRDALNEPEKITNVTLWHHYTGFQKSTFEELVHEFNETVGKEKRISVIPSSKGTVADLNDEVLGATFNEPSYPDPPNIFTSSSETALVLFDKEKLVPINTYLSKEEMDEFDIDLLENGNFDKSENYYIVPTGQATEFIMINKIKWDEFIKEHPDINKETLSTWDGIYSISEEYYTWTEEKTGKGEAFFGFDSVSNLIYAFANQSDTSLFEVKNNEIHSAPNKELLKEIWDYYYEGVIRGYFIADSHKKIDDIKTNKIIGSISSSSQGHFFPTFIIKEDGTEAPSEFMWHPYPSKTREENNSQNKYSILQSTGMSVCKSTADIEQASFEFIKWFTSDEQNFYFSKETGYLPSKNTAFSKDSLSDEFNKEDSKSDITAETNELFRATLEQANHYTLKTRPIYIGSFEIRTKLEALETKAKQDRSKVLAYKDEGLSLEEAIEEIEPDKQFDYWYNSFASFVERTLHYYDDEIEE